MLRQFFSVCPVPPDILDYPTSSDQVAREGANVTLRCAAHGVPTPNVVWKREAGEILQASNFSDTHSKFFFLILFIKIRNHRVQFRGQKKQLDNLKK